MKVSSAASKVFYEYVFQEKWQTPNIVHIKFFLTDV